MQHFDGCVMPDQKESLLNQMDTIFALMKDGKYRSLHEIQISTGYSTASISAQLRNLKKERFGGHTLNKIYVENGLWTYQIVEKQITPITYEQTKLFL